MGEGSVRIVAGGRVIVSGRDSLLIKTGWLVARICYVIVITIMIKVWLKVFLRNKKTATESHVLYIQNII